MIAVIRTKFGPKIIGGVVAVIAGIFIFSGVLVPGSGNQAASVAGEVNGETVSYTEYSRALNQRVEFFKGMMGGKITDEQMAQFKIREAVFQDLAQKKVLTQIAKKEGFYPSSEQIRDQILKMDAFKKDGHFDKVLYKNVLAQNSYSQTRFEELIGADLMEQNFRAFLNSMAHVSNDEIEKSFQETKNRRKIKYVYVDNETLRKLMGGDSKDDKDKKANLDQFSAEMEKKLLPLVNAGNEAAIKQTLQLKDTDKNNKKTKKDNSVIKTSDWLTAQSESIPGAGSIRMAQADLAAMKKGDPAKALHLMGGTLYAKVVEVESYDPAKVTEKERTDLFSKLQTQKQNEIMGEFLKSWTKKAKIVRNDKVVVGGQGANMPIDFGDN